MSAPRVKEEALVSCMSCGGTNKTFVLRHVDGGLNGLAKCPKCSNKSYVNNLRGLWYFMQDAAKEISQLKLDMIDLQDDGEER